MKTNAILTIITMMILANTGSGVIKMICWAGLALEFVVFTIILERKATI